MQTNARDCHFLTSVVDKNLNRQQTWVEVDSGRLLLLVSKHFSALIDVHHGYRFHRITCILLLGLLCNNVQNLHGRRFVKAWFLRLLLCAVEQNLAVHGHFHDLV